MKKSKTKHPCHDCDGCTYEHAALHERVAKLESRVPAIEVMQRFDWNKMRTVLDRLAALERALKPSLTSSPCFSRGRMSSTIGNAATQALAGATK